MDMTAVVEEPAVRIITVVSGEPVAIRKLTGGPSLSGFIHDSEGSRLRIRFQSDVDQPELSPADPVELTCPETLYLGEVEGMEGGFLIVGVQHSVDRAALAAIQHVWYRPESD
jgi:hypothetical protein